VALTAGWSVLAFLVLLPFVVDSSLPDGPRAPLGLLLVALACAVPAIIGGGFAAVEGRKPGQRVRMLPLLGRLPRAIRIALVAASIVAAGIALSGFVSDPPGNSVKTDTGYALRHKDRTLEPVTKQQYLANSRSERREILGAAIWCNAWGGALCWAAKLRDDEEDPL